MYEDDGRRARKSSVRGLRLASVRIHDLSLPLSERLPHWPGDPPFHRELAVALSRGEVANVSRLNFGAHTGNHVDAPFHFFDGGRTVDELPLEALVGPCRVVYAEASGRELTPFLLARMAELSEGATLRANIALLENNARVAAGIARALSEKS